MITVFTPTYNRAKLLKNCYQSLLQQTTTNFIWLIIDDGSTDNTQEVVHKWINESKISIRYYKQNNSGKHVAYNTAVKLCNTETFICIDSDDYLVKNAIEIIENEWDAIKNNNQVVGLGLLKQYSNGTVVGTQMPNGLKYSTIYDLYEKYKFKGDIALAFKTAIIKNYLFPTFKGEKFVGESVVYDQLSQEYTIKLVNKVIYIGEYLADGYTQNVETLYKENMNGYIFFLEQRVKFAKTKREKISVIAYYISECWRIHYKNWNQNPQYKPFIKLALPKAIILYLKVRIKQLLMKIHWLKA